MVLASLLIGPKEGRTVVNFEAEVLDEEGGEVEVAVDMNGVGLSVAEEENSKDGAEVTAGQCLL